MSLSFDKTNRPVFVKGLYFENGLIFRCGRYRMREPFTLYPVNDRCQNTLDEVSATVRCTLAVTRRLRQKEKDLREFTSGISYCGVRLALVYVMGCYRPPSVLFYASKPLQADYSTQGMRQFMEK